MRHILLGTIVVACVAMTGCKKKPEEFEGQVNSSSADPNASLSTPAAGTIKVKGKTYNCSKNNDTVTVRYDDTDPDSMKAQVTAGGKTYDLSRKTTDTDGEYSTTESAKEAQPVKWTKGSDDTGTLSVGSESAVTYHCVAAS